MCSTANDMPKPMSMQCPVPRPTDGTLLSPIELIGGEVADGLAHLEPRFGDGAVKSCPVQRSR